MAQGRGLRPILRGREAHPVCDVGDGIAVRVNLEFVQRLRRKWLSSGGPRGVHNRGRMHVHDQDRLVRLPRLGEGIQIREIQARVSVRETEVRTGVMVRHASPPPLLYAWTYRGEAPGHPHLVSP